MLYESMIENALSELHLKDPVVRDLKTAQQQAERMESGSLTPDAMTAKKPGTAKTTRALKKERANEEKSTVSLRV